MLAKKITPSPIPNTPMSISIYSTSQEAPHYHDGIIEIIYCFKGSVTLHYGYEFIEINAGDILSCNSHTIHSLSGTEDNLLISFFIDLKSPIFKKEKLDKIWFVCEKFVLTQKKQDEMQNLKHLLLALLYFYCFPASEIRSDEIVIDFSKKIINMLLEHFHFFDYMNIQPQITPEVKERYERMHIYINEHFTEKLTIERLSKSEHLTSNYLSQFFKKISYWSLPKHVNFARIRSSEILLLTTNRNISDIAYEVGFSDPKFYYKMFKAFYGHTPFQHRKMYAQKVKAAKENTIFLPNEIRIDLEHYIAYYFATLHIPKFWNVPFTYMRNVPKIE